MAGIFAGGASRRMGRPKALLPVAGGPSLLERTVAVVRAAGLTPVIVGRRPELPALENLIGRLEVRVIEDAAAEVGPLGGLIALLEDALPRGGAPVLALSCDLPDVQPGNLRSLMDATAGPAVLAPRREGHWEPLAARYEPALVLPLARKRLAAGQLGLQGLLDAVRSAESPARQHDGHLRWLDDWDTPDDVRRHESLPFPPRSPAQARLSMKLRARSGSIRLRLTRSEVDALAEVGRVEERVAFGPRDEDALTYALVASEAATAIGARFLAGERRIVVEIPRGQARTWATDEQVGFEVQQDGLTILVEKDFACLAPRAGTDDVDTFTHPDAGKPRSAC